MALVNSPTQQPTPRILVVGDLMVDHYIWGTSDRVSPEAPVPVIDVAREQVRLGGAGNVVENLRTLGAEVSVASVVGDDEAGTEILRLLAEQHVSTHAVVCEPGRHSPRKLRVMANHQQVVRLDRESKQSVSGESMAALTRRMAGLTEAFDAVLLSDYNKGVLTEDVCRFAIDWAHARSIPVLVDPKGTEAAKYRGATLITPNRFEAALLTGITIRTAEDVRAAEDNLRALLDFPYIVLTLSENGMAVIGKRTTVIPATAREVYDVTGAGDTVLATLGYCLACGMAVEEGCELANRAAAVVVGKVGSASATWDEILAPAGPSLQSESGIICSRRRLADICVRLRREGKRIVFTNGCFDLLHRGHVEYLAASRACGDCLIVGLNSDASVRRLKGTRRPIVAQEDRAHILAALSAVDYVVIFDEDTPLTLLEQVRPDVLTKGSDYQLHEVVGGELAGEVRLISLVEGKSTSHTIHRIRGAA